MSDGEILPFPVCVHHVEILANMVTYTIHVYTPLRRITFKAITFVNITCVFHNYWHQRLCSRLTALWRYINFVLLLLLLLNLFSDLQKCIL